MKKKKDVRSFVIEEVAKQFQIPSQMVNDGTPVLDPRKLFLGAIRHFKINMRVMFEGQTFTVKDAIDIIESTIAKQAGQ